MGFGVRSLPGLTEPEQLSCMVTLVLIAVALWLLVNAAGYALNAYHREKAAERDRKVWLARPDKRWHD